jgi:hypothetical protein
MREFVVNQRVRVRTQIDGPNRRVPSYVRGKLGVIVRAHGKVDDYQHDHADDWGPMYSVVFDAGSTNEKVILDLHQPWLEAIS